MQKPRRNLKGRGGASKQKIWTIFVLVDKCSLGTKVFIIIEILSKKCWTQKIGTEYRLSTFVKNNVKYPLNPAYIKCFVYCIFTIKSFTLGCKIKYFAECLCIRVFLQQELYTLWCKLLLLQKCLRRNPTYSQT